MSARLRAKPWWERCDLIGHVPIIEGSCFCLFCGDTSGDYYYSHTIDGNWTESAPHIAMVLYRWERKRARLDSISWEDLTI